MQTNWFNTLNEALESESLLETFPLGENIGYNETYRYQAEVNGKTHQIVIYRDEKGKYERPIHYKI
ncbi:hypothetical protein L1267_12285 [Pseudoalteromonas sp. OFAV1]|uniref:hypothetical protein n=1 Tax=Pseudoalteromonas sp. OFAV1 TaxID=2908892 RepID=UPI001F23372F|nr:hypothetical protein [Pseudoalteromonas sp. OFAV1]MCF2901170.1 hypothetical protein [Pseudoalteromonas sp. OFAV1]